VRGEDVLHPRQWAAPVLVVVTVGGGLEWRIRSARMVMAGWKAGHTGGCLTFDGPDQDVPDLRTTRQPDNMLPCTYMTTRQEWMPGRTRPLRRRETAVDAFRLLADPTRLRLLWLLSTGQYDVGTLAATLDVPRVSTSQHLARLRAGGLVTTRRDGRRVSTEPGTATSEP